MGKVYEPGEDPLDGYDPPLPEPDEPLHASSERLSPIELGAERSILSALLTTPKIFDDLCDELLADDFGSPAHQAIYDAIVACDSAGRAFDVVSVADEMSRAGTLRAGWGTYLNELAGAPGALDAIASHLSIILDRSLRRRMVGASRVIGEAALDPQTDAQDALDMAEQAVLELGRRNEPSSMASMEQVLSKTQQAMATARSRRIVGVSTGLGSLDDATGGLRPGQLILIAARPSMGKSVLGLQIAEHIAAAEGLPVPFYSYEMSHDELGMRLLASRTGIPLSDLLRGQVDTRAGMDRVLARELERLTEVPLFIDDRPPAKINSLRSAIRRQARRGPLGAVVVDYLQLIDGSTGGRGTENRTQEVSNISRVLKMVAVELNVPVIAISQLSRATETRPNKRPMLSDLRDSGSLEQDANVVLALYRDWAYDRAADPTHAELLILKNRQGQLAELPVTFEGPTVRFLPSDRPLHAPIVGGPAAGPGPGGWF